MVENLYKQWREYLGSKNERPWANGRNSRVRLGDNEVVIFHLFNTDIAFLSADALILRAEGWETPTTKERMNRLLRPLGYTIWSKDNNFRVGKAGNWLAPSLLFLDGITFWNNGDVTGAGEADDEEQRRILNRQINTYAQTWARKWAAGEIDRPGPGDCMYCGMVTVDGNIPLGDAHETHDHLQLHLDEEYYFGSIGANAALEAIQAGKSAPIMTSTIGRWANFDEKPNGWAAGITEKWMAKVLRAYLRRRLIGLKTAKRQEW